jgi:hypothetical protein
MDMFQDLLAQQRTPQVSPETLELLGTKAAHMFTQGGVPLNDAVSQVSAEDPNLGDEHIRRIVEFANNAAFQEMFEKSPDKNIHFDVADPGVIIRDLRDGGSPAHDGKPLGIGGKADYQSLPKAGGGEEGMAELSQMFAPQAQEATSQTMAKLAGVYDPSAGRHANPVDDVYDAHVRMQAARQHLAGSNEEHDAILKTAKAEFYDVVKYEVMSPTGSGLGGVIGALEKIASREVLASVLVPLVEKLAADGVSRDLLSSSLEKRAGKMVNPAHPLITSWAGMVKAAEERIKTESAIATLDKQLEKTAAFLREKTT